MPPRGIGKQAKFWQGLYGEIVNQLKIWTVLNPKNNTYLSIQERFYAIERSSYYGYHCH